MARPPRLNAEYFYHPADFRNDRRVKAVRARLGVAGYGLLLMLLEVLTDADFTQIPTDEVEVELLAGDLTVDAAELEGLISLCEKVGLFSRTPAGTLSCPQLTTWLEPVFEKRNRAKNAAVAPKLSQPVAETPVVPIVSVTETQPVQNSKVQNSKVEYNKSIAKPGGGEASPSESKNPDATSTRGAGRPAEYHYDEAPVFRAKAFNAYLDTIGYSHVDKAMYLLRISQGAAKGVEEKRLQAQATNDAWQLYIQRWLDRDKAKATLLLPDATIAAATGNRYNPPAAVMPTRTDYSIAARLQDQKTNLYL